MSNENSLRARARDSATVAAVPVMGDGFDLTAGTQPCVNSGGFLIRQQVDNPAPLKIANQCAVSLSFAPFLVVDADDAGLIGSGPRCLANAAQEGIFTRGQFEPSGKRLCRTSAESET